jgi:hypothetical protein
MAVGLAKRLLGMLQSAETPCGTSANLILSKSPAKPSHFTFYSGWDASLRTKSAQYEIAAAAAYA